MKIQVWASLQEMSVLEQVDLMLPDLVDEDDLLVMPGRFRRGLKKVAQVYERTTTFAAGVSLVTIGMLMLVPGPVDFAFAMAGATIGGYIGGPAGATAGAVIGLVIYNVLAIVVIIAGVVMIVSSLFGL
jgi:hypothetical protein